MTTVNTDLALETITKKEADELMEKSKVLTMFMRRISLCNGILSSLYVAFHNSLPMPTKPDIELVYVGLANTALIGLALYRDIAQSRNESEYMINPSRYVKEKYSKRLEE